MHEEKLTDDGQKAADDTPQPIDSVDLSKEPVAEIEQKSEIENLQPEINDMEVHHHTHAGHGKKTWKDYFWEFLMLFLAVFCGFLAEYFLEHKIEKERGKQFIESFYEDLKTDTTRLLFYTDYDEEKINALNNLSSCYDTVLADMKNTSCLLDVIRATSVNRPFMRTDRTLKQLANAGGFRLLNKEDADSILSFDKDFINFQDFQTTVFQNAQDNIRATFNLLVDFKANAQMFKAEEGKLITTFNSSEITMPILFSTDKTLLNKYFNEAQLYYRITYNHRRMLLNLKAKQSLLLDYFKHKYHFE